MGGVGVLGVGLLLASPAPVPEPAGSLAHAIYGWLSTGVSGPAADRSTSFKVTADPDAQALAVGAMASLGANLTPNPLAACWVQFPAGPTAGAKPTGTAAPVVPSVSGPLVLYGGWPGRVHDYPMPPLGPYPNLGIGPRLANSLGGVPLVGGVSVPGLDTPGEPTFTLNSGRGVSNIDGLTIPPGGWTAIALEESPPGGPESPRPPEVTAPPEVIRVPIATPEPGTLLLASLGLTALAGARRTRRG